MSLKLGNTNIAGTQVLYSTTGNNTDGAMTQAATTTQLNLKANDADVVHLTGNETINGKKTFTNTITESTSSTAAGSYVDFIQKINNARRGTIRTMYNSDGSYSITLGSNGPNASGPDGITVTRNSSSIWATAPASDVSNSIVTTVNKSKSENGYFKFGNGLIIQWGSVSSSDYSRLTITLPTPFSNTNYKVVLTQEYDNTGEYNANAYVRSKTTTNFNILGQKTAIAYIAVGY